MASKRFNKLPQNTSELTPNLIEKLLPEIKKNCTTKFDESVDLCFQINKKYIPKYLSIMRVIDRRFETGEIFIKWDDLPDEDWLILIYIKNNSPEEGIVIEDKTDPESKTSHEFQPNEIFKASDMMVDSLTKLLDRERNKKKAS